MEDLTLVSSTGSSKVAFYEASMFEKMLKRVGIACDIEVTVTHTGFIPSLVSWTAEGGRDDMLIFNSIVKYFSF